MENGPFGRSNPKYLQLAFAYEHQEVQKTSKSLCGRWFPSGGSGRPRMGVIRRRVCAGGVTGEGVAVDVLTWKPR